MNLAYPPPNVSSTPMGDLVRKLAAAGCTGEQIAVAVEHFENKTIERRKIESARKRAWRLSRHVLSCPGTPSPLPSSLVPPSPETPTLLLPTIHPPTHIRTVAKATRSATDQEFEEFWRTYPKREGGNPRFPAEKRFLSAVKSGVSPAEILLGTRGYAAECAKLNHVRTPFVAQASTWLNQRRWKDYQGVFEIGGDVMSADDDQKMLDSIRKKANGVFDQGGRGVVEGGIELREKNGAGKNRGEPTTDNNPRHP